MSEMADDRLRAVILAFLDHSENGSPEPSLDHLTKEERTEATELIDLIKDVIEWDRATRSK